MLQDVCVRTIDVFLLFIDNAAGCLCQNDRCVVIVHRQCCMYVCGRTIYVLLLFLDNACRMFVSER